MDKPVAPSPPGAAGRVEQLMVAYQATIQRQLEEGMRRIQLTANSLMHEIASEVWRTAGGDKDQTRSRILQEISRDQALRGLIAHSDERFQALSMRAERLEDTLNHVSDSVQATRNQLAEGVAILGQDRGERGADELRAQLAEVTRQVAAALSTLAERDQAIVDAVRERVREHGELITRETTRISAAMQAYVQHGVEAVGQLAGRMDAQIHALAGREHEVADRIGATVDEQMRLLAEQLQLLFERMAIDTATLTEALTRHAGRDDEQIRAVSEQLHRLGANIDAAARNGIDELRRTLDARVMGLAQLVRSDSEALHGELVRTAETLDQSGARALDERLSSLTSTVAEATGRMLEEFGRRSQEEIAHAIRGWIDEALAKLESRSDEQSRRFDLRTEEALSAIDRNMVRMSDAVEGQFERLGQGVAERAGQAAQVAIGERFDEVLARLHEATGTVQGLGRRIEEGRIESEQAVERSLETRFTSVDRSLEERFYAVDRSLEERFSSIEQSAQERFESAGRSSEEQLSSIERSAQEQFSAVERSVEQRFSALARLVRSDNETLAQQIVADQEATKQSLRAMKELQANLPAEVIQMVEQRFASLAESIERSNEMLAKRIDHMAVKIGERYDNDIQVVVDRMGDAMHALASLGRPGDSPTTQPRIELE